MAAASMMELMGIQAFSAQGSNTPFSLTGNQSFLSSIQPLEAAFEMNPLRALYWRAKPRTKNVGKASTGASHLERSTGLSLSRMSFLMMMSYSARERYAYLAINSLTELVAIAHSNIYPICLLAFRIAHQLFHRTLSFHPLNES